MRLVELGAIVLPVPLDKPRYALVEIYAGLPAQELARERDVRPGLLHVAGLHVDKPFRDLASGRLLDELHHVHERFGSSATKVQDRPGEPFLKRADNPVGNIVDEREVARHFAVAVNVDRLAGKRLARKRKKRHVRPTPGAVDRKVAQTGDGQAVEMVVGVRHELARFFCRGVEGEGSVRRVCFFDGIVCRLAVHGGARCHHDPFDLELARELQDRQRPHEVAVSVRKRRLRRVAHTGLRGLVTDEHRVVALKDRTHGVHVLNVGAIEREREVFEERGDSSFFERLVVVVIEVIDDHYLVALLDQPLGHRRPDKPRASGHENFFRFSHSPRILQVFQKRTQCLQFWRCCMNQDAHEVLMSRSHWFTLTRALLFLSLAAPVVYLNSFFFPYVTPKAVFLFAVGLLTMVCLAWFMCSKRGWKPVWGGIATMVSAFVGVQALAAVVGVDPLRSLWSQPGRMTGAFLLVFLFVFFLAMITTLRSRKHWHLFFAASIAVALATAILHVLSSNGAITLYQTNTGSTIGNSTLYGGYLLFQIGMAVYLFFVDRRPSWRWFSAIAAIGLIATLFLTDARAAQVSLAGGLVLAGALALITRGRTRAVRWAGAGAIATMGIVFLFIVGLLFVPGSAVRERFVDLTSQARFIAWDMAWQGFLERPLLGWGPETFEMVFAKYYDPCLGSTACETAFWFDRAHNIVLDMLVASGMLGFATYVGVFALAFALLWKAYFAGKIDDVPAIFVTSVLAAYVVQNLTGFDSIVSLYAWFAMLAFAHSVLTADAQPAVCKTASWLAPVAATLALPFLFSFFVIKPAVAFSSVVAAEDAPNMQEHLEQYRAASTVSSAGLAYRRAYLAHKTNTVLWYTPQESFDSVREAALAEITMAKEGLLDTLERLPNDLSSLIELGRLYQIEGRFVDASSYVRAEEVLREALRLHPLNPNTAWPLASVLLEQGKVEEAVAMTQEVLDRDPRVLKAHTAHLVAVKFLRDDGALLQAARASAAILPGIAGQLQFIVSEDLDEQRLLFLGHFY